MLNHLMIMGRLTADPEVRYTEREQIPVCRFSIATARPKHKDVEVETDFFNCVAWRNLAEIVTQWYKKGDVIVIYGTLRNRPYIDKEGKNRTATQIIVKEVHFTGGKKTSDNSAQLPVSPDGLEGLTVDPGEFEELFSEEDVPF